MTSIDASPAMIAAARHRAGCEGGGAEFFVVSAEALPFAASSFDVAAAITVLCFIDDASAALPEMIGVLKPGGQPVL